MLNLYVLNDTDTQVKNIHKKPFNFFTFVSKFFYSSPEETLSCTKPFGTHGGKYEGLSVIKTMSKVELENFLCRKVSEQEFKMIKAGGVPAAAFTLPEINWSDAKKVMHAENYEMVRNLLSNENFTALLDEDLYLLLEDLDVGTAPVFTPNN